MTLFLHCLAIWAGVSVIAAVIFAVAIAKLKTPIPLNPNRPTV